MTNRLTFTDNYDAKTRRYFHGPDYGQLLSACCCIHQLNGDKSLKLTKDELTADLMATKQTLTRFIARTKAYNKCEDGKQRLTTTRYPHRTPLDCYNLSFSHHYYKMLANDAWWKTHGLRHSDKAALLGFFNGAIAEVDAALAQV